MNSPLPRTLQTEEFASRLSILIETLPEAIYFKDGDGRWRVVNSAGLQLFKLAGHAWEGQTDLELGATYPGLGEAFQTCYRSDEIAWAQRTRSTTLESVVDPVTGTKSIFDVSKIPLFHADGTRRGLVVVARDVTAQQELEAREFRQRNNLRQISEIAALSHMPLAEQLSRALAVGAAHLGVEFGIVSHIEGDIYRIVSQLSPPDTLKDGQEFPLDKTCCSLTLEKDSVLAIDDMSASPYKGHSCYENFKLETYIGAPLRVNGDIYGTVNFSSSVRYHRSFDSGDLEFVHLLSRWAQSVIERDLIERRLRDSEKQLQSIIENEPECVKILAQDGTLLKMNRAGLAMVEADSLLEVYGTDVVNLVKPDYQARFKSLTKQVFEGVPGRMIFEMRGLKGTERWLETNAVPLTDSEGKIVSLLSVTRDVSEQKRVEMALRESEKRFRDTLEHAPIGMTVASLKGQILLANKAFCNMLGYDKDELESMRFSDFTHPDDLHKSLSLRQQLLENTIDSYQSEKRYMHKSGCVVWVQISVTTLRDDSGIPTRFVAQIEDVSQRKRDHELIHQLAYYDTLTNLPNRRLLTDRFDQAIAQAKRYRRSLAVMFLDLDHFKEINDRYGHDVGDELLKEVADRIAKCVRVGDTVSRQGGDEFIVVLPEVSQQEDAEAVARKILDALATPIPVGTQALRVTTSIGVSIRPVDGSENATDLMKKADMAMYAAKDAGRNQFRICKCPPGYSSTRCISVG